MIEWRGGIEGRKLAQDYEEEEQDYEDEYVPYNRSTRC